MVIIVGLNRLLSEFKIQIKDKDIFIYPVYSDINHHGIHNRISFLYIREIESGEEYLVSLNHTEYKLDSFDIIDFLKFNTGTQYVYDKKTLEHTLDSDLVSSSIDAKFFIYYHTNEVLDNIAEGSSIVDHYMKWFYEKENFMDIIPMFKLVEYIQKIYKIFYKSYVNFNFTENYLKYDQLIHKAFMSVEKNGLYVDAEQFRTINKNIIIKNNKVYNNYNLYTMTGRPSNTHKSFNFAAMNKKTAARSVFHSRFKDGFLVQLDFKAYHPRLLSKLIKYEVPFDVNFYKHLAKYYFAKEDESQVVDNEINIAKNTTFLLLYGGISEQYRNIPFLAKTLKYTSLLWSSFKLNGYIETPIFKRKLCHQFYDESMTSNVLLNYLIQAYETERNVVLINLVDKLIKLQNFNSKVVLYTYDSILIDFDKNDGLILINKIKEIMERNYFPVTISMGYDYKNMADIAALEIDRK